MRNTSEAHQKQLPKTLKNIRKHWTPPEKHQNNNRKTHEMEQKHTRNI